MRITTLFAGGALGLSLVLSSACSSTDGDNRANSAFEASNGSPAEVVKASVQRTTDAKTAQFNLNATLDGFAGSQQATGNGAVDFQAQKAQAHIELLGVELDGIVDGATVYANSDLLGDDSWYRLSGPDAESPSAAGVSGIWAKFVDPSELFAMLQEAAGSMTVVGSDKVAGVDTTHYTGNIAVPGEQGSAGARSTSIPVDVWVDGEGRVARVQSTLASGTDIPISGKVTVDFHDYGKAVTINPPPAGQVKDLSEALGLLGGATRPQQNP